MTDWMDRITAAVSAASAQTMTLDAGDGQLLLLPYGARIIGCAIDGVQGNALWHHPDAEDPDAMKRVVDQREVLFCGDRLWISPEVAYHWPDVDVARSDPFATYIFDPEVDPGRYEVVGSDSGRLHLRAEMSLTDHRDDKRIELRVERQISVETEPSTIFPDSLKRLSFSIRNTLTATGGDEGAVAGAWDILQLPATGTLVCPTTGRASEPNCYFGAFGDKHVRHGDRAVYFLIDAGRQIKMGIAADETTGRMAYLRALGGGRSVLIMRILAPQPGAPYVDLPLARPREQRTGGDCVQAYNDDNGLGQVGEMEYHDPAVIVGRTPATRTGASITHVLTGPDADIQAIGQELLGVPLTMS